jgi:twitching motility protein PilT
MLRYNLPERRKSPRFYVHIPVVCEIIDPKDKNIRSKSVIARDINTEGVYFETEELLPLNTEANLTFQLPKNGHVIHTTVRIARIETTEKDKNFGIGAAFIKLSEVDKGMINQLLERLNINKLLELTITKGASDLHLLVNQAPILRTHGELETLDMPDLSAEDIQKLIYSIMTKQQIKKFEAEKELDFAVQYDAKNRFRINLHQQKGFLEVALRLINTEISSFEDLNIPEVVKDLARLREGLVLIVGPTGSGKTTTIAAMIELINNERKAIIITLERPIEYMHTNIKSIIKQREVGIDTNTFSAALKSSLRQDPNVIVVGEVEDMETIRTAIIAAEAGYLVIASFHAPNTVQAIDRLASIFPVENRRQILFQLSNCMKGIISQLLIPRRDKHGRVLATEIVVTNEAVRKIIRNDELIQLPTVIQTSSALRMHSMVASIMKYYEQGIIDAETTHFYSEEFNRYSR